MGTASLSKNNRLFWLGRYSERVFQGVQRVRDIQDSLLDGQELDHGDLCRRLGLENTFESADEFCTAFLFDRALPGSLLCAADEMLGNGMVLRETISTTTLSYLQMAVTAMEMASKSQASGVELQWVIDDIYAFRGCCFDFVADEAARNVIQSGISVERLSTMLRFDEKDEIMRREMNKLLNRLYKTHLDRNEANLERITAYTFNEEAQPDRAALLSSVENLFLI